MRISDWSSDVCSSDLRAPAVAPRGDAGEGGAEVRVRVDVLGSFVGGAQAGEGAPRPERAHQGGLRGKFVTVSYIWGGHGLRPLLMGSRDRRRGPFLVLEGLVRESRLMVEMLRSD